MHYTCFTAAFTAYAGVVRQLPTASTPHAPTHPPSLINALLCPSPPPDAPKFHKAISHFQIVLSRDAGVSKIDNALRDCFGGWVLCPRHTKQCRDAIATSS